MEISDGVVGRRDPYRGKMFDRNTITLWIHGGRVIGEENLIPPLLSQRQAFSASRSGARNCKPPAPPKPARIGCARIRRTILGTKMRDTTDFGDKIAV